MMLLTKQQIELFKDAVKNKRITVGVFDLETSYVRARVWDAGKQWVSAEQIMDKRQIITAQFLYSLTNKPEYSMWTKTKTGFDDTEVLNWISDKLNTCDIVIAQNGKGFDYKVLQERLMIENLPPIEIDFMIDTLTASRSSVKSFSHSLDHQSKQLGLGGKIKMNMQDWIDIIENGVSPKKKMVPYGLKDTTDTDEVFWRKLPYYNLPKSTINKILKLIVSPEEIQKKAKKASSVRLTKTPCPACDVARRRKFDTEVKKGKLHCNNCKGKFDL
jgi:hypothetical protein